MTIRLIIADDHAVLDLGIGTGCSLNFYPERGRIVGIDLSSGMLREARKKIRERNLDHAAVFQADALHLPFGDSNADDHFSTRWFLKKYREKFGTGMPGTTTTLVIDEFVSWLAMNQFRTSVFGRTTCSTWNILVVGTPDCSTWNKSSLQKLK